MDKELHWTSNTDVVVNMYGYAEGLGLAVSETHAALGGKVTSYSGTKEEAIARLKAKADEKAGQAGEAEFDLFDDAEPAAAPEETAPETVAPAEVPPHAGPYVGASLEGFPDAGGAAFLYFVTPEGFRVSYTIRPLGLPPEAARAMDDDLMDRILRVSARLAAVDGVLTVADGRDTVRAVGPVTVAETPYRFPAAARARADAEVKAGPQSAPKAAAVAGAGTTVRQPPEEGAVENTFLAKFIVAVKAQKSGNIYYRVRGGLFTTHGVTCWADMAEKFGIDLESLELGEKYPIEPPVMVSHSMKDNGQPDVVTAVLGS